MTAKKSKLPADSHIERKWLNLKNSNLSRSLSSSRKKKKKKK